MNKNLTPLAIAASFFALAFITACSSSDSNTASLPPNAIVIDDTNALGLVQAVTLTGTLPAEVLGAETTQVLNLYHALDIIKPLLTDNSAVNVSAGADLSSGETCDNVDGTLSIQGTETTAEDGTTTGSGTASFINCTMEFATINGNLSFSFSEDNTGDYTESVSGSMTIAFNNTFVAFAVEGAPINGTPINRFPNNGTFAFSGFVFSETGNDFDDTYSTNELTYAIDFVIDGTQGGGYLVTLNAPLTESRANRFSGCHESGHIIITGANGTTAEGIFNNDDTVTIKANGEIVEPAYRYCSFN